MSKIRLTGATSGYTEIAAPATAGNNTLVLPATGAGSLIATSDTGTVSTAMVASGAITVPKLSTGATGTGVGFVRDAGDYYIIHQAPNGKRIQQCWGYVTTNASAYVTVTFPVAFTVSPAVSLVSYGILLGGYGFDWHIGALSTTSFQVFCADRGTVVGATGLWSAIGPVA